MNIADRLERTADRLPGLVILLLAPVALVGAFLFQLVLVLIIQYVIAGIFYVLTHLA